MRKIVVSEFISVDGVIEDPGGSEGFVRGVHLVPVVLGRGVRLLDGLDPGGVNLELAGVVDAPGVTHLTYRVMK